jgi:6,7-dimethyl-8-ribityllumazine synthase
MPEESIRYEHLVGDKGSEALLKELKKHGVSNRALVMNAITVRCSKELQTSLNSLSDALTKSSRTNAILGVGLIIAGSAGWVVLVIQCVKWVMSWE